MDTHTHAFDSLDVRRGVCHICGIPWDAGYFDESSILDLRQQPLVTGQTIVLASYRLHPNYCGVLMGFSQFSDRYARDNSQVLTPGFEWQIRCDGQPRDPYLSLEHILMPWGSGDLPVRLRLDEGCLVELVVRVSAGSSDDPINMLGGRITGRFWYNTIYGGAPNRL